MLLAEDSMQRLFIKKYFLLTLGSVCRVKRFILGGKIFTNDEDVETEAQKRLRKQSTNLYSADSRYS
jgi:hypothetical protein